MIAVIGGESGFTAAEALDCREAAARKDDRC